MKLLDLDSATETWMWILYTYDFVWTLEFKFSSSHMIYGLQLVMANMKSGTLFIAIATSEKSFGLWTVYAREMCLCVVEYTFYFKLKKPSWIGTKEHEHLERLYKLDPEELLGMVPFTNTLSSSRKRRNIQSYELTSNN